MNDLDKKLEKIYFSIGEAAEVIGVKPHVLRFWQKEFPQISPRKNNAGVRRYSKEDIELIVKIKELLHERQFTIKGAKAYLASEQEKEESVVQLSDEKRAVLVSISNRIDRLISELS